MAKYGSNKTIPKIKGPKNLANLLKTKRVGRGRKK